jgi:hypothetical protein
MAYLSVVAISPGPGDLAYLEVVLKLQCLRHVDIKHVKVGSW